MGSLASCSRLPHQFPENSTNEYRIYASFCGMNPTSNLNMSNWIECYNPSNNSWHRVTSIPGLVENYVLNGFAMVSMGDSIYVIGGPISHKLLDRDDPDQVFELDLEILHSVRRYNVVTDAWTLLAPMRTARCDFACTVSENKIYVAGGKCTRGSARGTSSAEVYDPAMDEWKPLPSMSTLRYKSAGVTWQGKIHVVGGFAERGDNQGPYMMLRSSAEVYDPQQGKWDFKARMWELDVPPNQIVAVSGRLFSSGDCFQKWKGHIEAYDGKLNIWNEVDGSHLETLSSPVSTSDSTEANWPPCKRLYLTMAPIRTHLYLLAGHQMAGEIPRLSSGVHVFDTSANGDGWRSFEPVEEEGLKQLCGHSCVLQRSS
ncbi:hypothetical protein RJ639_027682 [Escallonia herrerae]|uniref:Uncharacterized protein n=1 Tax=Escallonia herrerae TaxID=1293975 RepID=A0AA89BG22_9ASTE|nr:hypothetical protein RJ639_027682 [Escallonia herrerae]